MNCQVAQHGEAGHLTDLANAVDTEVQTQQCFEVTQAFNLSDAIALQTQIKTL